ncbi:FecR family protein [Chitinophaga deserti]|uniref:FecR family protein n=1 Tax=Chitinophaga deserti TaxID=2164099 RepID=UPI000D6C44D5|nr:FecR family protein [Chitinophaga deserti]
MENENHIRFLLNKEFFGTITPEEQEALNDLLASSAKARAIRSEIRNDEPFDGQHVFPSKELEADYFAVQQRHQRRKMQRIWNRRIAAGLVAGAVITALLIWPSDPPHIPPPVVIPSDIQTVTLQFANGEVIPFQDGSPQQYRVQSTGIFFDKGILRFESSSQGAPGWNSLNVPPGKESTILLSDGTEVILNSSSRLQFPFRFVPGQREVYLSGEGYFRIRSKEGSPFIIHAGQADIHAVDAICNINAYTSTKVIASLVSGDMEVRASGGPVSLQPGEEVTVATDTPLRLSRMQEQYTVSWIKGEQYFNNLPATELRDMIARWFNTTLYIDTPEAEKKLLIGKLFRNQTLSEFVDMMNAQNEVEFYWKNGMLHCR